MRRLSFFCASIAAILLSPEIARAANCEAPTVSWSNFPSEAQCVTGVIKFVAMEWGLPFPATGGHATKEGCEALGACIEWVYDLPSKSEWSSYAWADVKPQAYDIAVFPPVAGDAYGHIAMIDHVSGATLWLMDDNWDGLHEKSCAWEGHSGWVHATTWKPYGVFRLKKLEQPAWRAEIESQSWPGAKDAPAVLTAGETTPGWVKVKNTGTSTWPAGVVKLAPIPRDVASDLTSSTWLSTTRVSAFSADVKPGETAELEWDLRGTKIGDFQPYFGLLAEKITWFADAGGPSDKTLEANITVEQAEDTDPTNGGRFTGAAVGAGGASEVGSGGAGGTSPGAVTGGVLDDEDGENGGCSMSPTSASGASVYGMAFALALALRRRTARRAGR